MKKSNLSSKLLVSIISLSILFASCDKNKEEESNPTSVKEPTSGAFDNGVYITCEGPFGSGTGTVSFFNRTTNTAYNDVFNTINAAPLGNIVQSMEIFNSKGYVVVNNAGKIEVVNASTFVSEGKISGLSSPRFFIGIDANKGYVSQWGSSASDRGIRVLNLATKTAGALIPTGAGPEKMLKVGGFIYVVNSGGFGNDSTVTIINSTTDAVVSTLKVGDNPNSITIDKNGKIWVLCAGINDFTTPANSTSGKLVRINPSNNAIEANFNFASNINHPLNLTTNKAKDKLLYIGNAYGGSVFSFDITAATLPVASTIERSFYGLGIDPSNDQIFTSITNFSNGWILRYSDNAVLIDSFQVGIIPGNFCFN